MSVAADEAEEQVARTTAAPKAAAEFLEKGERPSERPVVYLASPLGFSETARRYVLPEFIKRIESLGVTVYEPFSTNAQNGLGPSDANDLWALDIASADSSAVTRADAVLAVLNGVPPDEGVAVELGIAIALGKPTFLFRDDFRRCADSNIFSCNLMLYSGLPRTCFKEFLYGSIEELQDPSKALAVWARTATRGQSRGVDKLEQQILLLLRERSKLDLPEQAAERSQ